MPKILSGVNGIGAAHAGLVRASTAQPTATVGSDLLVNGAFTTNLSGWTNNGLWAWNAGTAKHTAGAGNTYNLSQALSGLTVGAHYLITVTIVGRTAGTVTVSFGGTTLAPMSASDSVAIATNSATPTLIFAPTFDFDGAIDQVTVQPFSGVSLPQVAIDAPAGSMQAELRANGTNLGIGANSLSQLATATNNVALGVDALRRNVAGSNSTAVGAGALALANGAGNTAVGSGAGGAISVGANNTAIGSAALASVTTGGSNVAIGPSALASLTTASGAVAIGESALGLMSTATPVQAVAVGHRAGYAPGGNVANATTTNSGQVFIGYQTGQSSTAPSMNSIAIGANALVAGNYAIAIGSGANASGAIAIGYSASATGSNSVAFGQSVSVTLNDEICIGTPTHKVRVPGYFYQTNSPGTTAMGNTAAVKVSCQSSTVGAWSEIYFKGSGTPVGGGLIFKNTDHTSGYGEFYLYQRSPAGLYPRWHVPNTGGIEIYGDANTVVTTVTNAGLVDAAAGFRHGSLSAPSWTKGTGSPEGLVTAPIGSLYSRTDGGTDTTIYRKESGVGATGWVATSAGGVGAVASVDGRTGVVVLSDLYVDIAGDTMTGNLGLGITPTSKLHFVADTSTAGGIQFGADTNLYRSAADTLRTDDNFISGATIDAITGFRHGSISAPSWTKGTGAPEGVVTAPVGSLYSRTDGGTNTAIYRKESGVGATGWVAASTTVGGVTSVDSRTGAVTLNDLYVDIVGDTMTGQLNAPSVALGTNPATSGSLRLANGSSAGVNFRSADNTTNYAGMYLDTSNVLQVSGPGMTVNVPNILRAGTAVESLDYRLPTGGKQAAIGQFFSRSVLPFMTQTWADRFQHGTISNCEYWNGTAWTGLANPVVQEIFSGYPNTTALNSTTYPKWRVTFSGVSSSYASLLFLYNEYSAGNPPSYKVTLEDSTDGSTWGTLLAETTVPSGTYYATLPTTISYGSYIRLTIEHVTPGMTYNWREIRFFSDRMNGQGGPPLGLPFTWNYAKTLSLPGQLQATNFKQGASGPTWSSGVGNPEGVVAAPVGSIYSRTDGGADTALYRKEVGSASTGWVPIADVYVNMDAPAGPNSGDLWYDTDDVSGFVLPLAVAQGGTGGTSPTMARSNLSVPYVGNSAVTAGGPTTGTYAKGDQWLDNANVLWVCTAAGSPGTWMPPVGYELAYGQITSNVSVTATVEVGSTTVVTAPTYTFDGVTPVVVEFYSPQVNTPGVAGSYVVLGLFQDGVAYGQVAVVLAAGPAGISTAVPVSTRRRFTPSAGVHTYSIRAFSVNATGGVIVAGPGGPGGGLYMPAFIRITRA